MPTEPPVKRAVAFFDGQSLFHCAKGAFGYTWANYDPVKLATAICVQQAWKLAQTRFYTGIHTPQGNAYLHGLWKNKLSVLGRQPNIHIFSRPLRYRQKTVELPDGSIHTFDTAEEKGVDVRLALDLIRLAMRAQYDVALVFSQDQDLSEAADEVRAISMEQRRWIKIASAFPVGAAGGNAHGINKTDWIPIDKALYETCIDHRDYRPKPTGGAHP
ncbi:MAG: NYN domain-containing protein [Planctomycetota bacterium]|nr:NYN domain-containing protein [Planctomycetota bacterium]